MVKNRNSFMRSFNWWVENDQAWLIEVNNNILFCIDLKTRVCTQAVYIPDTSLHKYALTPSCMKYNREIWCIPGMGKSIWIYDLDDKTFHSIDLDTPGRNSIVTKFYIWKETLYIVSLWWNTVIEINLQSKKVEGYHKICEKDLIGESAMASGSIFMMSRGYDKVYEFDLERKKAKKHMIPNNVKKKFHCICYDEEKIWLSGHRKEVYVWNLKNDSFNTVGGFPSDFGVYDFSKDTDGQLDCITDCYEYSSFLYSVVVGDYVWFIPWQTNKIIYVNKKNYKVSVYEVDEEQEDKKSILSRGDLRQAKYVLEYIREERYIGLYSEKNNRMLEIDTKELKHQWNDYCFSKECIQQCDKIFEGFYSGVDLLQTQIYKLGMQKNSMTDHMNAENVGMKIYKAVKGLNI